jgi:hypothetical protein
VSLLFAEWKVNDYEDGGSAGGDGGPHALSTLGSSFTNLIWLVSFNNEDDIRQRYKNVPQPL